MRSRRRGIAAKLAGSLALAAMILLLAACGQTDEQEDPFVGTWLYEDSSDTGLIITKDGDEYGVATFFVLEGDEGNQNLGSYVRQGDRLSGEFPQFDHDGFTGTTIRITIEFDPSRGELTSREDELPGGAHVRSATPRPWPSVWWPSPDEERY